MLLVVNLQRCRFVSEGNGRGARAEQEDGEDDADGERSQK
jgi:hypothetical protein